MSKVIKLSEVGKIITGNTPKTDNADNYSSNDICFFKPSDIKENEICSLNVSEYYISEFARQKTKMLPVGTILVTCIGIIGKVAVIAQVGTCNQQINAIIPYPGFDNRYIAYSIYNSRHTLRNLANAPVVPILNKKQFSNIEIKYHPLETQKKIADVLDKAKSLIDLRKKQIEKMDLLIKSKFIEMFGDPATNPKKWRVVTFAEVATIDTHMTTDWEKYNGLPHIGIENIEKDTGHITKLKLVRDSELISGKYIFDKRHIIYSKIRPNLNKVALPDFTGVCSADAYPILPKSNTTRYYLAFILRSQHFLDYILSHSDRTNIPKVNKKQLAGFELPLPPVEDQNSFTLFVDSVEEQKYMLQHGLHKMEINYKSLMQEYFG